MSLPPTNPLSPEVSAASAQHPALAGVPTKVLVAVGGSGESEPLIWAGKRLADALDAPWQAIHIEVSDDRREQGSVRRAARSLDLAAELGGQVVTVPAPTVALGLQAHLTDAPATDLILGIRRRSRWSQMVRRSILDELAGVTVEMNVHLVSRPAARGPYERGREPAEAVAPRDLGLISAGYLHSIGLVAAAVLAATLLHETVGPRSLDLLFLFPVIAVSARFGIRPALLAVLLSVLAYNFFFLLPRYTLRVTAPQNAVVATVLTAVAVYTSVLTGKLRRRLVLSDRSADENAALAAFAQTLARVSDWDATARAVCDEVAGLIRVQTAVFREVEGRLVPAAANRTSPIFSPVDQLALEWAWTNGEEAGAGTEKLSSSDWQFRPLKTSLGVLAVLALARSDGRAPVSAHQSLLLSTLVYQAALACERLHLEDQLRNGSGKLH